VLLVIAGFLLAAAMRRLPAWRAWVRPVRWTTALIFLLLVGDALTGSSGYSGLFERVFAAVAAAALAALAVGVLRRTRPASPAASTASTPPIPPGVADPHRVAGESDHRF
jgi:hypothetical protein